MSQSFLGQIMMFGGNFAPKNFAFCNGQLLSINQYQALFTLLGTTYGGDGVSTFALPNLQSSLPLHQGSGPGLSTYRLGQPGGVPSVTITQTTMPKHAHFLVASTTTATESRISASSVPAAITGGNNPVFYAAQQEGQPAVVPQPLDATACSATGNSQAHSNLMPSLCISFVIALQGIFPSRN